MRNTLRAELRQGLPNGVHGGLALDRLGATEPNDGRIRQDDRTGFAADLARKARGLASYARVYSRWRISLSQTVTVGCRVTATSRLLMGHGNASVLESGLTLHHTYGVPVIPGAALKGVLAHYLAERGGAPWQSPFDEETGETVREPGPLYEKVFGCPAMERDNEPDAGTQGDLIFEDALWVPNTPEDGQPFLALDVLTPHHSDYYKTQGEEGPNEWTDPTPVSFVTVLPGVELLVAVTATARASEADAGVVLRYLLDALRKEGVGAKTRAGYGRLKASKEPSRIRITPREQRALAREQVRRPDSPALDALRDAVRFVVTPTDEERRDVETIRERLAERFGTRALIDAVEADRLDRAEEIVRTLFRHKGLRRKRQAELAQIKHWLERS